MWKLRFHLKDIDDADNISITNGGNVYVRFTTRSGWFNTNYYVAEAKLDDLLNKVVTLNFKEI